MRVWRWFCSPVVLVLAATALVAGAPSASALQGTVPGVASPTWQTNGTVWAIASVGGVVYVGGDFTAVRPPGAAPGTAQVTRNRIAAFDAATGDLITSFNPGASASVRALRVSPDGGRLYVGGDFTTIAGQPRSRLAAFSTATGSLLPWTAAANGRVTGIAAHGSTVWIGGYFSRVGTTARSRVAALDTATAALRPGFAPVTDNVVYDIDIAPAGDRLYLAGGFLQVNGNPAHQAAAVVDAVTGADLPFPAAQQAIPRRTPGCIVEMKDITVDDAAVYYAAEGTGGGCFDGTFSASHTDGSTRWISRCLGATQGIALLGGRLYTGSHAHDCLQDAAFDPDAFPETGWARGLSRKLLARDAETGRLSTWYPNTNGGPPGGQGPRTLATDGSQIFVGGEFTSVNGVLQQGLTRFSPAGPEAAPQAPAPPRVVARGDGRVAVFVQAPTDADDVDLVLRLFRNGTTEPIATADVRSLFWRQPVVGFEDAGLTPGSTVGYSVEVAQKNGANVSPRVASAPVTVLGELPEYAAAVAADEPVLHWRMGEPAGPVLADAGSGQDGGTVSGSPSFGVPGAVPGDDATRFDGSTSYATSERMAEGPASFTVEAWFQTTTTGGGRIIGFGDNRGGLDFNGNPQVSSQYDKHVYMTNDGRLVFGVYVGGVFRITTSGRYNDGQWHHVVGTQGPDGMTLYVDGVRVGRNGQTQNQRYPGVWRIGGDNLNGWPDQPSSRFFAGAVDEVAVYHRALPASAVAEHYRASGRTPDIPPAPTDAYGAAVVADEPSLYWRLDETGGTTAADSSGSQEAGAVTAPVTWGVPGSPGTGSSALRLGGSPAGVVSSSSSTPSGYATELWFRTSTGAGGKLIGFGNQPTGNSSNYDKHVYMRDDGRLVFGVYLGGFVTLVSDQAYNDGEWHHLVASQGPDGMALYVDNVLVGSNATSTNQVYAGYWRVGGDNLAAWPGRPSSDWFVGDVDEVAVYPGPLTAAQVDAHHRASGRTGPDTVPPAVSITSPQDGTELAAGDVLVEVSASDAGGVSGVELLVDGVVVGSDDDAPYEVVWDAQPGDYSLAARAVDGAGNSATSATVSVTVLGPDTVDPEVAITSPTDGAEVYGPVTVAAAASDDRAVAVVRLLVDGVEVGQDDSEPYTFEWSAVDEGSRVLVARAVDTAGNTTESAPVVVVVPADTTPPAAVTGLVADQVTATGLRLRWQPSEDDRGQVRYEVSRNGEVVGDPGSATEREDGGLEPATTYAYSVVAVDEAGNRSAEGEVVEVTTLPARTEVFADSWDLPDGAPWAQPWATSASSGSVTAQSGSGRLAHLDAPGAFARASLGTPAEQDVDLVLQYRFSDNGTRTYFSVFARGSGGWRNAYRPRNGYGVELSSTSGLVAVQRALDGGVTNLALVPGAQQVTTAPQMLRLQVDGDLIRVRIWPAGTPEPTTWTAEVTDSSVTAPGTAFLSAVRAGSPGGARHVEVDDLTVERLSG